MLWPYVLSGLTFVLVVASAAYVSTLTYVDVVAIQLGVLLAYNAWKWPVKARQALQLSVSER